MMVTDFAPVIKALKREKVLYLLVGGIAAIGHGMTHTTNDLDICYERSKDNLRAIVRALRPSRPKLRTPEGNLPFLFDEKTLENGLNFTLDTHWGWIDLLGELAGLGGYRDLLPKAVKIDFFGIKIDTISLDDLIRAKQIAGRTKDKLHLLELEAIKEMKDKGLI